MCLQIRKISQHRLHLRLLQTPEQPLRTRARRRAESKTVSFSSKFKPFLLYKWVNIRMHKTLSRPQKRICQRCGWTPLFCGVFLICAGFRLRRSRLRGSMVHMECLLLFFVGVSIGELCQRCFRAARLIMNTYAYRRPFRVFAPKRTLYDPFDGLLHKVFLLFHFASSPAFY